MKSDLLKLLMFASRQAFYIFLVQVISIQLLTAEPSNSQDLLSKTRISLDLKHAKLEQVFEVIEAKTDFKFTFGSTVLEDKARLTLKVHRSNLREILEQIAEDSDYNFRRINSNIYVINRKNTKAAAVTEEFADRTIEGKVNDSGTGEPLIGAAIQVKGSNVGTVTDINGTFTLNLAEEATTLIVSYVGYESQEIQIGSRSIFNVSLKFDAQSLAEVVVIGYGSQSKAKVTGAISSTDSEELEKYAGSNFEQQLAGRLSGVQVNETGGQPGYDAQIVIRGVGTLTAGAYPLVVVDGVPLSEGSTLSSINPADIEKIDVLKDAASAAIYGARASNGVLLITTKRGKTKKPTISFDAFTGVQMRADQVEYAGAYDAAQYFTEARDWGYVSKDPETRSESDDPDTRLANGATKRQLRLHYLDPYLAGEPGLTDTDWLDEIFRAAPMTSITTSVSGNNEKSNYYVSGGYFKQEGIAIGTSLERFNATIKVQTQLNDIIDFGINLNPSYSKQEDTNSGDWRGDPVAVSYTSYPFFSPYLPDGSLNISEQLRENTPEDGALQENAVAYAELIKDQKNRFRTFGSAFLTIKPIKGLEFKTLLGGDYRNYFFDFYDPSFLGSYRAPAPDQAKAIETNGRITNILTENTLNYFSEFGDHELDVLTGYSYQREEGNESRITGAQIPDDNITNVAGASSHALDASRYIWTQISYFGRVQYFFKSKYQLSAAVRRDGSSRFGDDSKWGVFPSVSASWILSNESFFPGSDFLTFAKFRASWGKTGNNQTTDNQFQSYSSKALVTASNYTFGGSLAPGFAATTSPNRALSWETNESVNIGIDLGLFEKFTLSANYYRANTNGLLLEVPVPEQSGFSESLQNIGEVRNTGIELELGANDLNLGPVKWSASANFTSNNNEVLALGDDQDEIKISGNGGAWITRRGAPVAEIFSYKVIGVYKTQEEIDQTPHLNGTLTGDYIVEDVNGDGVIDEGDQVSQGTYAPEFFYGFSSNFRYGNFDLSFGLNGVHGRTVYNYDQGIITETGEGFGMPTRHYFENRYHPVNNPDGFFAQPNMGNFSSARRNTRASDIYMQSAAYLRMRFLQIGYTLPRDKILPIGLENLRVYISANNLFTITDYRGFNPDASTDNILRAGYARDNHPIAKSFIVGANLTLK